MPHISWKGKRNLRLGAEGGGWLCWNSGQWGSCRPHKGLRRLSRLGLTSGGRFAYFAPDAVSGYLASCADGARPVEVTSPIPWGRLLSHQNNLAQVVSPDDVVLADCPSN